MDWTVEFLNTTVRDEITAMPPDIRARLERIVNLIQSHGLTNVHEPFVKHLEGPLWEMRMKGRDGIGRAIYVTVSQRRVIIVRGFIKKTQKTPLRELEIARTRAKEILP